MHTFASHIAEYRLELGYCEQVYTGLLHYLNKSGGSNSCS